MQRKPPVDSDKSGLENFINGAKDTNTNKENIEKSDIKNNKLKRQTYYIYELFVEAINQMAFYEKMDKSEIVRTALENYIPEKYIKLATEFIRK
jgi:hypothetical protein